MLPPGQPGVPYTQGILAPGQSDSGMLPTDAVQSGMPPPPPGQFGMLPPGPYPGYHYGQAPPTPSDPSHGQTAIPITTSQQGTFNMTGMASALPQQMPYMGQQPQPVGQQPPPHGQGQGQRPMGQALQGYLEPQQGPPLQPSMMTGTGLAQQDQQEHPQPGAPAESL